MGVGGHRDVDFYCVVLLGKIYDFWLKIWIASVRLFLLGLGLLIEKI